jgi:hypothetical protein
MNGYELSRNFFDFCFENPEKVKPNHVALYFFAIEHCNRLGWKEKFGLPTEMAKDAIGINSYNTYSKTLSDLIEWGFIILVQKSVNQYSSNIVAISKFDKALDKALDKAMIKHDTKQRDSTIQSIDSIDKHITSKQVNNKTKNKGGKPLSPVLTFLIELPNKERLICERFINYRKDVKKKPIITEKAIKGFYRDLKAVTENVDLWDSVLDIMEEKQWMSVNYIKLEETTTKETIHIAYDYACCMAGVKTEKERRWFLKEITKYPPEFIGVLAFYWKNAHDGEMKKIIEQHLVEEWHDKKRYYGNYNRKTPDEHIAHWTEQVRIMKDNTQTT